MNEQQIKVKARLMQWGCMVEWKLLSLQIHASTLLLEQLSVGLAVCCVDDLCSPSCTINSCGHSWTVNSYGQSAVRARFNRCYQHYSKCLRCTEEKQLTHFQQSLTEACDPQCILLTFRPGTVYAKQAGFQQDCVYWHICIYFIILANISWMALDMPLWYRMQWPYPTAQKIKSTFSDRLVVLHCAAILVALHYTPIQSLPKTFIALSLSLSLVVEQALWVHP